MRWLLLLILIASIQGCSKRPEAIPIEQDQIVLTNGNKVDHITLSNTFLSISVIPELGGKICSIKNNSGREFLHRSDQAYAMRRYGMKFKDSEQDGIDECFPSRANSSYPLLPWKHRLIPEYGEIYQLAWTVDQVSNTSITCSCTGKAFPYEFTRTISIEGRVIHFDYSVSNVSAHPFHAHYTFHPMLAGAAQCSLELPDEAPIALRSSSDGFLGEDGCSALWQDYLDKEGRLLKDHQYEHDSKKQYSYDVGPLLTGFLRFRYADGYGLSIQWPSQIFPNINVTSKQGIDGVHYICPSITNSSIQALATAFDKKQTLLIHGNSQLQWRISMTIEEPVPEKEQANAPSDEHTNIESNVEESVPALESPE